MALNEQKSPLNIVMGAMTFGKQGTEGARVHELKDVEAILDIFKSHGHSEIDTARVYCAGTSEEYLGQLDLEKKGFKLQTKLYPTVGRTLPGAEIISHRPEDLRTHLLKSLKALGVKSLDMWYLHGPDRSVPYEITLKAVNDLYKEGYFERFGISNYTAWEVAEIVTICRANGYIQPTVYQGLYNAIHRAVEPELFPCLRKYGISFYAYNPLGGGLLAGRYIAPDGDVESGSRFDPERSQGKIYRQRYWKDAYFSVVKNIVAVAEEHSLTVPEIALRWMTHHSELKREHGDAVIIGASNLKHIEQNLVDFEKGPLPEKVLQVLDEGWRTVQPYATNYFH